MSHDAFVLIIFYSIIFVGVILLVSGLFALRERKIKREQELARMIRMLES